MSQTTTPDQDAFTTLRDRVEAYAFDRPGEARPFSARLRQEQRWSAAKAARAIAEYRRFLVLAGAAGHTVSPSPVVDAVWHLHLTDTRRYWDEFCPQVLGRPLHHEPSRGGPQEREKHTRLYARTLEAYARLFGEPAPRDVWPAPGPGPLRRAALGLRAAAQGVWRPAAVAGGALLTFGCAQIYNSSAPGGIDGQRFIVGYVAALLVGLVVMVLLQRWVRRPGLDAPTDPGALGAYELACLAGGASRVLETVVLKLFMAGSLVPGEKKRRMATAVPLPAGAAPAEVAVWDAAALGRPLSAATVRRAALSLAERLRGVGLVPDAAAKRRIWLVALVVMGPLLGLGVVRLWYGGAGHRPTGFLITALVMGALFAWIATLTVVRGNDEGRRLIKAAGQRMPKGSALGRDDPNLLKHAALWGLAGLGGAAATEFTILQSYVILTSGSDGSSGGGCSGGGGCGGGCGG